MKKNFLIMVLFLSIQTQAQGKLTVSLFQDAKLATIGDNRGNNAFTMDLLTEVNLELRQDDTGYPIVGFTYEKANLVGGEYVRWSTQFGYTFNELFLKNIEVTTKVNWGGIERFEVTKPSFGASLDVSYKINNWLAFGTMFQFVERSDKNFNYRNPSYTIDFINTDFSLMFGIIIDVFSFEFSGTKYDY